MTNENMLVSLDDSALDEVTGGASISIGFGDTNILDASLSLKNGIAASVKVLGFNTVKVGFNLFGDGLRDAFDPRSRA